MTSTREPPSDSAPFATPSSRPAGWWAVVVDSAGEARAATQASIDGVIDSGLILRALDALEGAVPEPLPPLRTARSELLESRGPLPGRDAIELWAPQAVDRWRSSGSDGLVQVRDGLGWRDARGRLRALARHDHSVVAFHLPPDTVRWELRYRPSEFDLNQRRAFLTAAGGWFSRATAWWSHQDVVEFVIYAGAGTTMTSAEAIASRWRPKNMVVDHDQRQGIVIAKVTQQLKKPPKLKRDRSFQPRLAEWLEVLGPVASRYPEVADLPARSVSDAVVFVHGTLSCGLAHIREVAAAVPAIPGLQVLRFEHDTFLPVLDNAQELVELINKVSAGPRAEIILIGHSRGGLVARAAAAQFAKHPGGPNVGVCTFGTPHRGTPLVRAGERVLAGLAAAASAGISHIGVAPVATAPVRYLFGRLKKLPIGILNMAEDDEFLRGLDAGFSPAEMLTFGADFQRGTNPSSRGVLIFDKFGKQFFFDNGRWQPNDLLVSVESATAVGAGYLTSASCGHFDYLWQPELAEAVRYMRTTLSHP